MILIIDSKIGNTGSVYNALYSLGENPKISSNIKDLEEADKIILPGVGSFGVAIRNLNESGLIGPLRQAVMVDKKPFLGICLGMQLLASTGKEGGEFEGLGFVPGVTRRFEVDEINVSIPHVGWNDVVSKNSILLKGIKNPIFYFVHSYHFVPEDSRVITGSTQYGENFVSVVEKENIFGVQFHPEKSQHAGLALLENFLKLN